MPRYTYTCTDCGKPGELVLRRKYDERDLPAKCSVCKGNLSRSPVERFAICKKLGDGPAPQRRHVGMRLGQGAYGTQLDNCGFTGFGTGIEVTEGSSLTSRGVKFRDCDTAYDIDGAECDITDTEIE